MLDTYCNSITDEAQLRIALTLGKLALPVWEDYFSKNPTAIDQVNALIIDTNRVNGSLKKIDVEFPKRALEKIEQPYNSQRDFSKQTNTRYEKRCHAFAITGNLHATIKQSTMGQHTESIRAVSFYIGLNMLVWILYRRNTKDHETHIYVAINQGADVLLREKIKSAQDINTILHEYELHKRQDTEDSDWENALPVGRSEPPDEEDIYRKIIGEKVVRGQISRGLASEVLRQMREEGKTYWNMMDEYATGTSTTYSYDTEKQSYSRHELDAIVGSFSNHILMTESEMLSFISQRDLYDLQESGFEV